MEIITGIEQGSPEWFALRDIPTASCFDKILTGTTLKPSAQAKTYRYELHARHMGVIEQEEPTEWMLRGIELEEEAAAWYAFEHDVDPEKVSFIYGADGYSYGCSPDRLIVEDGMAEFKCPKPSTHIGYLLSGGLPATYKAQVFGQLFVAERTWCDFVSYCPGLPEFLVRVTVADPEYQKWVKAFEPALKDFISTMLKEREVLNGLR